MCQSARNGIRKDSVISDHSLLILRRQECGATKCKVRLPHYYLRLSHVSYPHMLRKYASEEIRSNFSFSFAMSHCVFRSVAQCHLLHCHIASFEGFSTLPMPPHCVV
jgi:hypothetical protein